MTQRQTAVKASDSASPELAFAQSGFGQKLLRILAEGSASHKTIADFLLRNQIRAAALGIGELAESCHVSTATVSRFARDVGFKNYAAMRSEVGAIMQAVLQPADKLRRSIAQRTQSSSPGMDSLNYAAANIEATARNLSPSKIDAVVAKLSGAETIYVMGFGLTAHLAALLALQLQPYCRHVVDVACFGGTENAAGRLMDLTPKDVLIAISFPRYSIDAIKLSSFARHQGACIIAITDSPASPLALSADLVLLANSTHPVLPSSATAALALIETVVTSLMVSNKQNVAKAVKLTDAIASYLYGSDSEALAMHAKRRRKQNKTE